MNIPPNDAVGARDGGLAPKIDPRRQDRLERMEKLIAELRSESRNASVWDAKAE